MNITFLCGYFKKTENMEGISIWCISKGASMKII